ncbi:maturation of Asn-linked oligosaccharides protein [Myotisia sp. PD_48]|nr:maturation of Asn-linked oligosaccharides protein [Myotisia sp. PD_48]
MKPISLFLSFMCLTPTAFAIPASDGPSSTTLFRNRVELDDKQKAQKIKDAFNHAWGGYMKYAAPKDELRPVTNGSTNPLNGWGATLVDSLSTALIMELKDVVKDILDHVEKIDYSKTDDMCSLFETTIRYLGGMISGYDLLKGPFSHLAPNAQKVEALRRKSKELADVLKFAFDSDSGVPWNTLNITHQTTDGSTTNGLATTGTLVLEWIRLSDQLEDPTYGNLALRAEEHLLNPKPEGIEPFPGLVGGSINIETGEFEESRASWEAGDDSFYEYLIKMYIYDPRRFEKYKDRWVLAAESSIRHLKSSPPSPAGITYIAAWNNGRQALHSQHLACFAGGNFILGGRELGRSDFVKFGLELVDGCHNTYVSSRTKIGPEVFGWNAREVPPNQREFFKKAGFYYLSPGYVLRPEVVESYYYAYRITGNEKYKQWIWDAFVAITETTTTASGFSSISDVNAPGGGRKTDSQPSFFFAETLKYIYLAHVGGMSSHLIFADEPIQLTGANIDADWQISRDGKDKYVFNTEAHPFKVYGT